MPPELAATLTAVAEAMTGAERPWWIIGSAAVALLGASTEVADVDVLLAVEDAARVLEPLGLAVAPGIADDRFRSTVFASWRRPPLPVEFMAGLSCRNAGAWYPVVPCTWVTQRLDGRLLHTPDRAELAAILRRFGRAKDLSRAALLASG